MMKGTEFANFEAAQGCIDLMIAERANWIFREEQKPVPDAEKIVRWLQEQNAFDAERKTLRPGDHEAVGEVLKKYGVYLRQSPVARGRGTGA